eukprot:GFUD01032117.1.p1 GENE.GFUD01032117.1~~GFUD01032117.1.p1  ORF type:complete len:265 (+),score=69.31 GFUD01032117.1:281-1075(+)
MRFKSYSNICLVLATLLPVSWSWSMDVDNGGGEIIRSLPCVKKHNQLYCDSASGGISYPSKAILQFIEDNKALMRRMYGEQQVPRTVRSYAVSSPLVTKQSDAIIFPRSRRDVLEGTQEEMMDNVEEEQIEDREKRSAGNGTASARARRQADFPGTPSSNKSSGKEDVCQSTVEIVTPYWASNSNGKVRAILNNKEFEQAIHQEICSKASTPRCSRDCSCEQKYKWHRLLAYDPNNDCSGIFMDWFLFPSCCACRCTKNPFLSK